MLRKLQEGRENLRGEVISTRFLQHETDYQKPSVLYHVLLNRLGTFHQVANESEQFRTVKERRKYHSSMIPLSRKTAVSRGMTTISIGIYHNVGSRLTSFGAMQS